MTNTCIYRGMKRVKSGDLKLGGGGNKKRKRKLLCCPLFEALNNLIWSVRHFIVIIDLNYFSPKVPEFR